MITQEKKNELKELIKINKKKRNLNSIILRFLIDEIEEMINKNYPITTIKQLLNLKLGIDIKYSTLANWINRNIKNKNKKGGKNATTAITQTDNENDNEKKDSNPFAFLKN